MRTQNTVEAVGENPELFTIGGATHIDLYDNDEYADLAVDKPAEFVEQQL